MQPLLFFIFICIGNILAGQECNAFINYDMYEEKFFVEYEGHTFEANFIHSPKCECNKEF